MNHVYLKISCLIFNLTIFFQFSIRQKKLQQQLQDAANEPIQIKNV